MKAIADLGDLRGKRVLLRCDLNVPLDGDTITDDGRIRGKEFRRRESRVLVRDGAVAAFAACRVSALIGVGPLPIAGYHRLLFDSATRERTALLPADRAFGGNDFAALIFGDPFATGLAH